jgi:two-component system OmpR family response regulator
MSLVCVVDNDRAMLSLLGRALQDSGLAVDLFASGAQLIQLAGTRRYDLVLLDIDRPDVDGVVVIETLRGRTPSTQVMVVSASNDAASRVRFLDSGACDFVSKPFDLSELLARTRAHLRPRIEAGASEYLQVGEIRLDIPRRQIASRDRTATLSPREFLLLRHLMGKAGQVCSREELLKDVWGYDFEADSNVVDKYVSRVRTKLPGGLIETIRHVGFSFLAA